MHYLKKPVSIALPEYVVRFEAQAGLDFQQFPLQVGKISAQLLQEGQEILHVTTPEEATDRPFREDVAMVCFSSHYDRQCQEDFGEEPPF